jgi:hypothetical protein
MTGGSGTDSPRRLFRAARTSAPETSSPVSYVREERREQGDYFAHADFPMPIPLSTATMLRAAFQGYCVLAISRVN